MPDRTSHHLALDIGGTNCRVRVLRAAAGDAPGATVFEQSRALSGKPELRALLASAVTAAGGASAVTRSVMAFAGPVQAHREVRMTNWPGTPRIELAELREWLRPHRSVLMVNDMEASALGILAALHASRCPLHTLHAGDPGDALTEAALVLAPGTGLGTLGILRRGATPADPLARLAAAEFGHAAASPVSHRHAALIGRHARLTGHWPSWEDFVSGPGLVATFTGLLALDGLQDAAWVPPGLDGAGVARAAREDSGQLGRHAREALGLYHAALARVAQSLALVHTPRGGIFLYGASVRANLGQLDTAGFVAGVQDSVRQAELLRRYPVHAVTGELNLDGCLWLCAQAQAWPPHERTPT